MPRRPPSTVLTPTTVSSASLTGEGDGPVTRDINSPEAVRQLLVKGCRALTPVVIDLGPGNPRLASYLFEAIGKGRHSRFRFHPIDTTVITPVLAGASVTIRTADPDFRYVFRAHRLVPVDETTAEVALREITVERLGQRQVSRSQGREREPLVLLAPSVDSDIDVHAFPIIDLSAGVCAIDATEALEPGHRLDPVEIVGDRRRLRRASATVLELIPWRTPHGRARFRTRMALGPSEVDAGHDVYHVLSDPSKATRILQLAAMLRTVGSFEGRGIPSGAAQLLQFQESLIAMRFDPDLPGDHPTVEPIRVSFDLFDTSYQFDTYLRESGEICQVSVPLFLRRRRRRRERRVALTTPVAQVEFRNPATRTRYVRPLVDVSFGGLCFEGDEAHDVLWEDLPLEEVRIEWKNRKISVGDIRVRALEPTRDGSLRCHASFQAASAVDDLEFIEMMATLGHPTVSVHDGEDFQSLFRLYDQGGLLAPHMRRNIRPALPAVTVNWLRAHRDAGHVVRTLMQENNGTVAGTFSSMRAWERAWIVQHLVATSSSSVQLAGILQIAYLDHVLPRPDSHYVVFFVKSDNTQMNVFHDRFFSLAGTNEAVERSTVSLWSVPLSVKSPHANRPDYRLRPMRKPDEKMIGRGAAAVYGTLPAAAFSMAPGELRLPDTRKQFARAKLLRGRKIDLVTHRGVPAVALLEELASPGLNLTYVLNATWVLPLRRELDGSLADATIHALLTRPSRDTMADRFVVLPDGLTTTAFERAGYVKEADVHIYALNRAGLARYYQYIFDRYGAVGAWATKRMARRAAKATSPSMAGHG